MGLGSQWRLVACTLLVAWLVLACAKTSPTATPPLSTATVAARPTAARGAGTPSVALTPTTMARTRATAATPRAADYLAGCAPAEIEAFLARFLDAFNRGDLAALQTFFPAEAAGKGNWDFAGKKFQNFSMTDQQPIGSKRHFVAYDLPVLWAYFADRFARHERLALVYLGVTGQQAPLADLTLTFQRTADDVPADLGLAHGKAVLNCRDGTFIFLNVGQGSPTTETPAK